MPSILSLCPTAFPAASSDRRMEPMRLIVSFFFQRDGEWMTVLSTVRERESPESENRVGAPWITSATKANDCKVRGPSPSTSNKEANR